LDLVDPSRTAAALVFDDTAAVVVADGARAERAATAIQRAAALGLSCDALGGAGIVVEQAVDYAKARVQFGRPIGSFQAVKHRLANLYVLLQGMNAIVGRAVRHDELWDQGDGGPSALTDGSVDSVAHAYCSGAYARIAGEAILVHGAIGFTWEHRLHRHLKRALLNQHLAGPVRLHRLRHLGTRLNSLGVAC
jgi:alkylation response protein AidB-like acyl-CoA dehydrogenase